MIVKFFDSGVSSSRGPINYLLQENDANGKKRNPPAELFSGDTTLTSYLIDNNKSKFKYTSLVIAFRDNEKPTDKQLRDIFKTFMGTMAPGLSDKNVNSLAVKHTHEGNIELHIVIPKKEMTTNKAFNIHPPGKLSRELVRDFTALVNDKYGWDQVNENPLHVEFSAFDKKVPAGQPDGKRKEKFSKKLIDLVKTGVLKDREDLIKILEKNEIEVTRKGVNYISLKFPNTEKSIKFSGPMFSLDSNYSELLRKTKTSSQKLPDTERNQTFARLQRNVGIKLKFNKERYLTQKPKRTYRAQPRNLNSKNKTYNTKLNNLRISCKRLIKALEKIQTENKVPTEATTKRIKATSRKLSSHIKTENQENEKRGFSTSKTGPNSSLASIESSIQSAIADLANAKTLEEKFRALYKLMELMEQRRRMYFEMYEQNNKASVSMGMKLKPR